MRQCSALLKATTIHAEKSDAHLMTTMKLVNFLSCTVSGLETQFGDFAAALETMRQAIQTLATQDQEAHLRATQSTLQVPAVTRLPLRPHYPSQTDAFLPEHPNSLRESSILIDRSQEADIALLRSPSQRTPKKKKNKPTPHNLNDCRMKLFEQEDEVDDDTLSQPPMDVEPTDDDASLQPNPNMSDPPNDSTPEGRNTAGSRIK